MSVGRRVASDHQLARLLQIGIVLEEVVEARAHHHYRSLDVDLDAEVEAMLADAADESADHRERLEALIADLDAESVPFDEVSSLVGARYGRTRPDDFDGVLYDQLCNEETAYKFYDDLIGAIEDSDASFSVDRAAVLDVLRGIRAEEADGVEEVTALMGGDPDAYEGHDRDRDPDRDPDPDRDLNPDPSRAESDERPTGAGTEPETENGNHG